MASVAQVGRETRRRAATVGRWCAVLVLAVVCLLPCAHVVGQETLAEQPIRIRIAWGGSAAERWTGTVALEGGTLSEPHLLGMEADAAAAVWLDGNALRIDSPSPHLFDGVDVTARATAGAQLAITLSSAASTQPLVAHVPLADVLREPYHLPLDDRGNELLIQRSPGDSLRITCNRDSLLFRPGEQFTFDLQPLLDDIEPSTTIDITTTLTPARGSHVLWSHEQRLPVPVEGPAIATLHVPLPREEGVYQIRLAVALPPGFRQKFFPGGKNQPLIERTFQVIVLGDAPPPATGGAAWTNVLEIDPANPGWTERLPNWTQLRRIPGFSRRPLGSVRATTVAHSLGSFVELPPTPAGGEPHWQAYPLPVEAVGVPHLLEIEYPNDREQHLGISIVEPNAAGRAVPIGRDSGVYVEGLGHAEPLQKSKHRVVFWPRTNAPLLLVSNQHPSAAGRFGAVRVLKHQGRRLAASSNAAAPTDRMIAAYIARPLLPESFGASESLDPLSHQSVEDSQTFFESASRLADYVSYAGYNAAVVNVFADGCPLFVSERVPATPLHHTGRMVSGTNDLPTIDPLELMLRVFDRQGLAFVPALQFATPLPELEALRRELNPRESGIELVNHQGRTWQELHGSERGIAPHYNLLDERVQAAMLNVARDILQRYGNHRSLSGLSVQLSSRGYSVLPGLEWGADEATLARFERDTKIELAGGRRTPLGVRQQSLLSEHADAWREWRAAQVTRFYGELAKLIQANDSRRRLLLTTEDMFATPELAARIRPNILAKMRLDRAMLDLAINREALRAEPSIVFCPTQYVESMTPLVDRAVDLEINDTFATARQESANRRSAAMLLYHRARRQGMPSFDAQSPFPSHTTLVTQSAATSALALRPYVAALQDADPYVLVDGGELLPLGEADSLRQTRLLLRALPASLPVQTTREQNLLVRVYESEGQAICLIVNELPWHVDARLQLDLAAPTTASPLSSDTSAVVESFSAGTHELPLALAPYEVRAMRFSTKGVQIAGIRSAVSEAGRRELAARRADLRSRDLNTAQPFRGLVNPSFEPPAAGGLEGWRLVEGNALAMAELDTTEPHDGATCMYFQNQSHDGVATLESNSFATPPTGQLAMVVFVRGQNLAPNSEVRLVFEVDRPGEPYRHLTTLGGSRAGSQPLGTEWGAGYAFRCEDLPLDSRSKMRVKFELVGPGEVWIDDVKLYDLLFPLPFYQLATKEKLELVKLIMAVETALDEGRLSECVQLLDGYWPRFISAYTPLDRVKVVEQPILPDPPRAEERPPQEESPSIIGRFFTWPGTQKR